MTKIGSTGNGGPGGVSVSSGLTYSTGTGYGVSGASWAGLSPCDATGHVITNRELVYQAEARSPISFICSVCATRIWIEMDVPLDLYEAEHLIAEIMGRRRVEDLNDLARLETTLRGHASRIIETLALLSLTRRSLTRKLVE